MLPDQSNTISTIASLSMSDIDRENVADHLANAMRHLGIAPRNRVPSRIPIRERATLVNRSDGVIDAPGALVVPTTDEENRPAEAAT